MLVLLTKIDEVLFVDLKKWIALKYNLLVSNGQVYNYSVWRRKQTEQAPSWKQGSILKAGLHLGLECELWAICQVSMKTTYQLENQTPWMEEPQART